MVTIACVLNPSVDFDALYVYQLAAQVARHTTRQVRFVCLAPRSMPGIVTVRLEHEWPSWWAKMETYRLEGPVLFLDLDTVLVGSIDPLIDALDQVPGLLALRDLGAGSTWIETGIVGWRDSMAGIYQQFAAHVSGFTRNGSAMVDQSGRQWKSDGAWVRAYVEAERVPVTIAQEVFPGIYSYKYNVMGKALPDGRLPEDARIICFHGRPRPRDLMQERSTAPRWLVDAWHGVATGDKAMECQNMP